MTLGKRVLLGILCIFLCLPFSMANAFIVRVIQVQGLQRITSTTVRSYLPFHEGENYTPSKGDAIITALYKTGFFKSVQLYQRGSALVIDVVERPTISLIQLSGNKEIPSKKLRPILTKMGISEGLTYNPTKVNEIVLGLEQQYETLGYRAALVTTKVIPGPRNTVSLYITVHEGTVATVRSIKFVGNHDFSQRTLRGQMDKMTTRSLFTWISHKDRYSPEKLQEDLQALTDFYLNHGYLRFRIVNKGITFNQNKTGVYIVITLSEGPVYHIGKFDIVGETYGFHDELYKQVPFKKGDVFSRQGVLDTDKALSDFLGDRGYAFATVNVSPMIDDEQRIVNLTFDVVPGARVYVRRMNFFDNERTDQVVLRREMRQYEASTYSLSKIEESKRRLKLLGYLEDITETPEPVDGQPNQVDLDWHVKEIPAGRASIQGGYSSLYKFLYGASISEPNFMGTGKYVSLGFQNSQYSDYYSFSYNNPYYTTYGLSRGFTVYYSHVKPNPKFNFESYLMDGYGIDVNYGLPVSERNSLALGYGFEHIAISQINPALAAPSILNFLGIPVTATQANFGRQYNEFTLTGGWAYNGLDRAIFPTKGFYNGIGAQVGMPIIKSSIGYYSVTYNAKYYQPLGAGFVLNLLTNLGWGDGFGNNPLPFFKNFFSGGIGSVPAFAPNSLGPKNRYNSDGALGGNLELLGGVHLILPSFISQKVRTAIIFDAGNVFQVPRFPGDIATPARASVQDPFARNTPQIIQDYSRIWHNIRPSLGLGVEWWSPIGPIDLTLAFPINKQSGDDTQPFQFSFGVSL